MTTQEENLALKARIVELEKVFKSADRLLSTAFKYESWTSAGGGEMCEHGINKGIHCRECDLLSVVSAINSTPSTSLKRLEELERLAETGKQWESDSSLEKWFPITAETIKEPERKAKAFDWLIEWLSFNDDVQKLPCRDWTDKDDALKAIEAAMSKVSSQTPPA